MLEVRGDKPLEPLQQYKSVLFDSGSDIIFISHDLAQEISTIKILSPEEVFSVFTAADEEITAFPNVYIFFLK